ncbi:hypothetical protein N2152v2_007158 [Parachlorella kessleri]
MRSAECQTGLCRPQGRRRGWSSLCSRPKHHQLQHLQQQRITAQALGSRDSEDDTPRPVQRGSTAVPLRVFSPLAEATSALSDLASLSMLGNVDVPNSAVSISDVMAPVKTDMEQMRQNLRNVVGRRHPLLMTAADQIFSAGGKRLRPLITLLVARATLPLSGQSDMNEKHRRLAEIVEMLHTASLVHDDVLDDCDLRRGKATVNSLFGTRVAVLVGDFLFAQSSWYLAQLENLEVIKLISQVIADFADGEISQAANLFDTQITLEKYLDKSHFKTASLIAAACRCAAVFSDCTDEVKDAMYEYGKHLGLAFQVVDDILDFTQSSEALGKPQGQDLASGNLTAPVLFALQDPAVGPRLLQLIKGRFKEEGTLQQALALIHEGGGIARSRQLAREEGRTALAALSCLPDTPSKRSLERMVDYVLDRLY